MRRKVLAVAAILLSLVAATAAAQPVQAFSPAIYHGHVYNGASTRCLDSGIPANAQLWTCSTAIYQDWWYNAGLNARRIVGNSPSGCLDDGAGLNGSGAFLTACTGSLHQKWDYLGAAMVNEGSGRCLDADEPTLGHNGTKVQVWDCNGGANQQWYFEFEP